MKNDNNQQQQSEPETIATAEIEQQSLEVKVPDLEQTNQEQQSEPETIATAEIEQQSLEVKVPDTKPFQSEPIWVKLIKAIRKATPIIWITVVLLVLIPLLGQFFIHRAFLSTTNDKNISEVVNQPLVDWSQVDEKMTLALKDAHESARSYASDQLDLWVDELMTQVDSSFLDWYFDYFSQKNREFKGFFIQLSSGALRLVNSNSPTPEEKVAEVITEDFQEEFAKRVLRPKIAQLRLERLTQQTISHYLEDLRGKVDKVQRTNKIPLADWNRYLSDIAITINDGERRA